MAINVAGNPCPICTPQRPNNPRIPRQPPICDGCRNALDRAPRDIRNLYIDLTEMPDVEPDERTWERPNYLHGKPDGTTTTTWSDPIVAALPTNANPARIGGTTVSGTREPPAPTSLDRLDLTAHARAGQLTNAGNHWSDDQIGNLPIATELDFWVTDWIAHRNRGERRPAPNVPDLCQWLADRTQDACDDHPAIDEYAADMRRIRTTLRQAAGLVDIPDYKAGVACRRCGRLDLVRPNGSDWIECRSCPELMSPEEYERWVGLLAASVKHQDTACRSEQLVDHQQPV